LKILKVFANKNNGLSPCTTALPAPCEFPSRGGRSWRMSKSGVSVLQLVKAAIKAGLPADRLRVIHDKKNDKLIVEVVAEKASTATDLDDWLAKHADSTQGH
jgi:hypothetical protein